MWQRGPNRTLWVITAAGAMVLGLVLPAFASLRPTAQPEPNEQFAVRGASLVGPQ